MRVVLQQVGDGVLVEAEDGGGAPVVGLADDGGQPVLAGGEGSRARMKRLSSRTTVASRLRDFASLCPGLIFLRLRLCDPIAHSQPLARARPSMSASSSR